MRNLSCAVLQEPERPDEPPEEFADPNYFTAPALLTAELKKLEEANAEAKHQLQVSRTNITANHLCAAHPTHNNQ